MAEEVARVLFKKSLQDEDDVVENLTDGKNPRNGARWVTSSAIRQIAFQGET